MAIPPLVLRIYADSTGVKKGVAQAQTQVGGLRASVIKNAGLIKTGLIAGVVVGMAAAAKAASDLGEAQNKVNVIFGKSSGVVNTFAQDAHQIGLAEAEALDASAAFGAMFDSAGLAQNAAATMSVSMSKLAGDMASFNNESPVEMLDKLRSGLAGEAEPLRRFGVFISEARVESIAFATGIAKAGQKLTDAQKVQARYNIILKDTKKQQGDFGRTVGESLPNQIRQMRAQLINLAATLGKVLLPVILPVVKALNLLLTPLRLIADVISSDVWERFAADLAAVGTPADQVTRRVKDLKEAVDETNGSLRGLGGAMGAIARQEAQAAEEAEGWAKRQQAVQVEINRTQNRLDAMSGTVRRFSNVTEEKWAEWSTQAQDRFDAVGDAFDNLAGRTKVTAGQIIAQFTKQAENVQNYRKNLQEVAGRNIPDELLQQLIDMGIGGSGILAELAGASDAKFGAMVRAMKKAERQTDILQNKIDDLRGAALKLEDTYSIRLTVEGATNAAGFIGGQRAGGGPVGAMRPYVVGEAGPELFIPAVSGTIIPNNQLNAAGGTTIVINGDVTDPDRFARKVEQALNRAAARH